MADQMGYRIEIDAVDRPAWLAILHDFDDASHYQTWAYGKVRCGEDRLSHLLLREEGVIVAAAQVALLAPSPFGWGAALVHWGPLWRRSDRDPDWAHFDAILEALYDEYVVKRGLLLRIVPRDFESGDEHVAQRMAAKGYTRALRALRRKTIVMDLTPSMAELRKALKHMWRQSLNRAADNGLDVSVTADDSVCDTLPAMFEEMHRRQKFVKGSDITPAMETHRDLEDAFKLRYYLACKDGDPIAGLTCSCLGDTPVGVVAATTEKGRKLRGMYAVYWRMVEDLKDLGFAQVDLAGIDEKGVPGVTRFKTYLVGKRLDKVRHYAGPFEACVSPPSRLLVRAGESLRDWYYAFRRRLNRLLLRPKDGA